MLQKYIVGNVSCSIEHIVQNAIEEEKNGITIAQLSKKIGISRPTLYKYVKKLNHQGLLIVREVGKYVLYSAKPSIMPINFREMYFGLLSSILKTIPIDFNQFNQVSDLNNTNKDQLTKREIQDGIFEEDLAFKLGKQFALSSSLLHLPLKPITNPQRQYNEETLLEVIDDIRLFLMRLHSYQINIVVLPQVGLTKPLTRVLKITGSEPIKLEIRGHFRFLAGFLQWKLAPNMEPILKFSVINSDPFDVEKLPVLDTKALYFEVGFVTHYYFDISIPYLNSEVYNRQEIFNRIKHNFLGFVPSKFEIIEYQDQIHYIFHCTSNHLVEEYFELIGTSIFNFFNTGRVVNINHVRPYKNYVDWPESSFLILNIQSNSGFFFEDLIKKLEPVIRSIGYNLHIEKSINGWHMEFKDRLDFDLIYPPSEITTELIEYYNHFMIDINQFSSTYFQVLGEIHKLIKNQKIIV